jgi:hypothetical protein
VAVDEWLHRGKRTPSAWVRLTERGGGGSSLAPSKEVADEDPVAETVTPDGRVVRLYPSTWQHIIVEHSELEDALDVILEAVAHPHHRQPDARAGRERFFRRGGPQPWIRVVVEFSGSFDRVVTAFPQSNDPEGWSLR